MFGGTVPYNVIKRHTLCKTTESPASVIVNCLQLFTTMLPPDEHNYTFTIDKGLGLNINKLKLAKTLQSIRNKN